MCFSGCVGMDGAALCLEIDKGLDLMRSDPSSITHNVRQGNLSKFGFFMASKDN